MVYSVVLAFESVDETLSITIVIKAFEQYHICLYCIVQLFYSTVKASSFLTFGMKP